MSTQQQTKTSMEELNASANALKIRIKALSSWRRQAQQNLATLSSIYPIAKPTFTGYTLDVKGTQPESGTIMFDSSIAFVLIYEARKAIESATEELWLFLKGETDKDGNPIYTRETLTASVNQSESVLIDYTLKESVARAKVSETRKALSVVKSDDIL